MKIKIRTAKPLVGLATLMAAGLTGQAQCTYTSPKRNLKTKPRRMKVNPLRTLARHLPGIVPWLAALPCAALDQANYATPYTFTTFAGGFGIGSADGTNSAAQFAYPCGAGVDTNGNVYVADTANNTVRKVTPSGVVTTLAGLAGVSGSANGTNSAARFNSPYGVAVDTNGNVYASEWDNETIRKLTPAGTNWAVTTIAGLAGVTGSQDGTGSAARFYTPSGVAADASGNLFVADVGNCTIRKLTPVGTNWAVTTIAGLARVTGSQDGTNHAARFMYPYGVAVDGAGNVYVADSYNHTIRQVTPVGTNWVVRTIAGLAGSAGSADGTNSAARFNTPYLLAADNNGNVYVGDSYNYTIRKVAPVGTNWVVTTLAGLAGSFGSADGTGSAAWFFFPHGVAVDGAGNLYVGGGNSPVIRKGLPAGSVPAPILEPPSLAAGQFSFAITGLPNLAVNIESSGDLSQWQLVGTYILEGGTNSFAGPKPPEGVQFYRAHVR